MSKRRLFVRRLGCILCTLVVTLSCFGGEFYFANDVNTVYNYNVGLINTYAKTCTCSDTTAIDALLALEWDKETYPYYVIHHDVNACRCGSICWFIYIYKEPPVVKLRTWNISGWGKYALYVYGNDGLRTWCGVGGKDLDSTFSSQGSYDGAYIMTSSSNDHNDMGGDYSCSQPKSYSEVVASNCDIYVGTSDTLFFKGGEDNYSPQPPQRYNSSLGYLQNVARKKEYLRGDIFYNYDDESLKYVWTHDLKTTTDVDLTSGDYVIRHYISKATVKGYEKDDIVEMSDKYFLGEYDASLGRFEYFDKDYDEKILALGYEPPDWIDKYLRGYFVLEHHYFQIVNVNSGEYGGYLHLYPKDTVEGSWLSEYNGVELNYEETDDKDELIENGNSGVVDDSVGAGSTYEDAEINADEPKLGDFLEEAEIFADSVDTYASQVGNVTSGFGVLLGSLPSWVLGLLGLGVGVVVVVIVVKGIRG